MTIISRIDNPYYEIEEKHPQLVASWIRDGVFSSLRVETAF